MNGRGRGRGARARGRGKGRGRGRGKKAARAVSSDEESTINDSTEIQQDETQVISKEVKDAKEIEIVSPPAEPMQTENIIVALEELDKEPEIEPVIIGPPPIDMEADISQLEAPTFTTISRGPPEPMVRLKWNHKVSLIGEKVLNPMIHCCDQCLKPILIYGRMIPCKHVFCLKCARSEPVKICPRCKEKVCRVEQSGLGSVFMCSHGGTRYGNTGCRRTYLSQRDLQAHINHRHIENTIKAAPPVDINKGNIIGNQTSLRKSNEPQPPPVSSRTGGLLNTSIGGNIRGVGAAVGFSPTNISTRTNLITVPIQDSQPNIPQVIGIGGQQSQPGPELSSSYYSPVQNHPYSTSGFNSQQFNNILQNTQSKSNAPPISQHLHNLPLSRSSSNSQQQSNQPYFNQSHYQQQYTQIQPHYQQNRPSYEQQSYGGGGNGNIQNNANIGQGNVGHTWNQQQYYR